MTINGYVFQLTNSQDWAKSDSEEWILDFGTYENVKHLGSRDIDDTQVQVYMSNDEIIAITTVAANNIKTLSMSEE